MIRERIIIKINIILIYRMQAVWKNFGARRFPYTSSEYCMGCFPRFELYAIADS